MSSWWKFVKYNNTVPIVVSLMLLSFGTSLAASPEIRQDVAQSVLSSETKVVSVDNTYIANKDLSNYTPTIRIESVSEDNDFYYVQYALSTIDIQDSVWQDVTKDQVMRVQKGALENGQDLGSYVTRNLRDLVSNEIDRLKKTQDIERQQVSQKVVATTYSGLIGKLIDDTTQTLPSYVPQNTGGDASTAAVASGADGSVGVPNTSATPNSSGDTTPPVIQILGNNPAHIDLHSSYIDLGVVVTDNSGLQFGHKTYVNGAEVTDPTLDTTKATTYTIKYTAQDAAGNTAEAIRTVIVGDPQPAASSTPASTATSTGTTTP